MRLQRTMENFMRPLETLDCCLHFKYNTVGELRLIIKTYLYQSLTDETIHEAVKAWCICSAPNDLFGSPPPEFDSVSADHHLATHIRALLTYGPIEYWNTEQVTDMNLLFYNFQTFNDDISRWNTSNVINMSKMFQYAVSFNQPLNEWDVSKVKNGLYVL